MVQSVTEPITLREEKFEIQFECLQCAKCGHRIISDEQLDRRIRATVKAYQRAHGFLTADEIQARRKQAGFATQQEFSSATQGLVAIATLKRVEAGQHAQDLSTDFILRKALEAAEEDRRRRYVESFWQEPLPAPVAPLPFVSPSPKATTLPMPLAASLVLLASAACITPASENDTDKILEPRSFPC